VDDEPLIVKSLTRMLGSRATVVGETVAQRALELVLGDPPFDAVVCDVMMPGMTGVDLHARVAREKPERARRFVFITGGTYTARAREYLERAANPRLDKPFDVTTLLAAIERVVVAEGG
jgi:CheY-like chemotaxis protein